MSLELIQAVGVFVTLVAAAGAIWNAHTANRNARSASQSEANVQYRTVSLDELEKALTFTGEQLKDLREETILLQEQVRKLERAHQECERDKRRLHSEIESLRRGHP